jgi:autoinducer 2-degrading protein
MTRAVVVELRAKPDQREAFLALIDRHAHNSRTLEEGCLVFDVCQDPSDPATFVLYEVYKDEAAHTAHREMDSFKWFMKEAPEMLVKAADGTIFHSRRILERRPYWSG